jgi:NitT/TauT family transport system ATP-binding protein
MTVLPSRSEARLEPPAAQRPAAAMIEIDGVSQVFQTSTRQDHLALSDISLTIEDGAFVSILGPSGCGKSTLLYIVGGFVHPTRGAAKMKGGRLRDPVPTAGRCSRNSRYFPGRACSAM